MAHFIKNNRAFGYFKVVPKSSESKLIRIGLELSVQ